MALFGTVCAFLLWFRSIKHIGPARTSVFLNLVPIFTVVLANVFLDEALGPAVLVSLAVIVAGVLIVQLERVPATKSGEDATRRHGQESPRERALLRIGRGGKVGGVTVP
jgi:drug/metabolite transporter (DMT)-like permease